MKQCFKHQTKSYGLSQHPSFSKNLPCAQTQAATTRHTNLCRRWTARCAYSEINSKTEPINQRPKDQVRSQSLSQHPSFSANLPCARTQAAATRHPSLCCQWTARSVRPEINSRTEPMKQCWKQQTKSHSLFSVQVQCHCRPKQNFLFAQNQLTEAELVALEGSFFFCNRDHQSEFD